MNTHIWHTLSLYFLPDEMLLSDQGVARFATISHTFFVQILGN